MSAGFSSPAATGTPRAEALAAEAAGARRAEKDALEREAHTRYMLNQLQKSHDAQARAASAAVASLEALRSELAAADAQAVESREQVAQLQAKLASSELATPDPSVVTQLEAELRAARQSEQRMTTMLQQAQDQNAQLRATLNKPEPAGVPAAVAAPARAAQASLPTTSAIAAPTGSPRSA